MAMTVEEYAIEMCAAAAESVAEDDLNEDGELSDEDHARAIDLAIRIAHTIQSESATILALTYKRFGEM